MRGFQGGEWDVDIREGMELALVLHFPSCPSQIGTLLALLRGLLRCYWIRTSTASTLTELPIWTTWRCVEPCLYRPKTLLLTRLVSAHKLYPVPT